MRFFAPITKINESTREVEGVIALEIKDKDGEIMDYASSKVQFQTWSDEIFKNSGGKSHGNVREMHGRSAVGKLSKALVFDDENKRIVGTANVYDDNAWGKVQAGILNGFSVGGDYLGPKVFDKVAKARRYTVKPTELSLVDNPCMYGADFSVIKGNGEVEVRKFTGNKEVTQFWSCPYDDSHHHETKSEAQHCETIEKVVEDELNFQNSEPELVKIRRGDKMSEKKEVVEDEKEEVITNESVAKVASAELLKMVKGKEFQTALKSVFDEAVADLKEDISVLSETVLKLADSPAPTKVVTKVTDGKKKSKDDEEDDDDAPRKAKVIKTTSNPEDLIGSMRKALKTPIAQVVDEDDESDEDAE